MTDIEKVRSEIERQIHLEKSNISAYGDGGGTITIRTLEWVLSFIDSMQPKSPPNLELIKRSWYVQGYIDRENDREPMWRIKTFKGGPKYEKNPKYGQKLDSKESINFDKKDEKFIDSEEFHRAAVQAHIKLEEGEGLSFVNIFKAGAEWQRDCDRDVYFWKGMQYAKEQMIMECEGIKQATEDFIAKKVESAGPSGWECKTQDVVDAFEAGALWLKALRDKIDAKNPLRISREALEHIQDLAHQAGKEDMLEQIMKEAVEGEAVVVSDSGWESIRIYKKLHKCGDKVKLLIFPADEN